MEFTSRNIKRFEQAKSLCSFSDFRRAKVGCVVSLGSKVLSVGFSSTKTHPIQQRFNSYRDFGDKWKVSPDKLHAEVSALIPIMKLDIDWSRVEIYVYRLRGDNTVGNSRPCEACSHLIKSLGIRKVYYTTDNGYSYERYFN